MKAAKIRAMEMTSTFMCEEETHFELWELQGDLPWGQTLTSPGPSALAVPGRETQP